MVRDRLFILPPGFLDNGRREFCPECAEIAGFLAWHPAIRDALDICHVGIGHPRRPITDLLGEGRFNAPTLVLAGGTDLPEGIGAKTANGRTYLDSTGAITALFAHRHGTPVRRGGH